MNERQTIAHKNPCYINDDLDKPIFEQTQTVGRLTLRTQLKILAFFQNELWRANVFVSDENGIALKESELTEQENIDVTQILYSLLENVGRDKILSSKEEFDFDAVRFLSKAELKKLPPVNFNKLFRIKERQEFALKNPFPTIEDMLAKKYTLTVDVGGGLMKTVLTVEYKSNRIVWHASVSAPDINDRPQKFFGEVSAGQAEMSIKLMKMMLSGVGSGEMEILMPDKDCYSFHVFRSVAVHEKKGLSPLSPLATQKQSPFFAKRLFN